AGSDRAWRHERAADQPGRDPRRGAGPGAALPVRRQRPRARPRLPRRDRNRTRGGGRAELRGAAGRAHQRRQRRDHPVGRRRRTHAGAHPAGRGRRGCRRSAPDRIPDGALSPTTRTLPRFSIPLRSVASAGVLALARAWAAAVAPLPASHAARYMGLRPDGRLTRAPAGDTPWKYSLEVRGAGARLAQSTVFEAEDGKWPPISGSDSQAGESGLAAMLVKKRAINATYDWDSGQ